jgi:hypothetical protein
MCRRPHTNLVHSKACPSCSSGELSLGSLLGGFAPSDRGGVGATTRETDRAPQPPGFSAPFDPEPSRLEGDLLPSPLIANIGVDHLGLLIRTSPGATLDGDCGVVEIVGLEHRWTEDGEMRAGVVFTDEMHIANNNPLL